MIVSFDLDDTLFIDPEAVAAEAGLRFPFRLRYRERLRLGTVALFNKIQSSGIKLWVYTTSFRSEGYIRAYFRHYGVKIDHVINGERHQREVQGSRREPLPSKYPARYRIDLHIDDDVSVEQNGRAYGFKVYLLEGADPDWADKLWARIESIKRAKDKRAVGTEDQPAKD